MSADHHRTLAPSYIKATSPSGVAVSASTCRPTRVLIAGSSADNRNNNRNASTLMISMCRQHQSTNANGTGCTARAAWTHSAAHSTHRLCPRHASSARVTSDAHLRPAAYRMISRSIAPLRTQAGTNERNVRTSGHTLPKLPFGAPMARVRYHYHPPKSIK